MSAPEVSPEPLPLARASLAGVTHVLADVDGTLTVGGRLTAHVLGALERLRDADIKMALVTGRPAGFAECFLRTLPVDAVVAENGGVTFTWSSSGQLRKTYAQGDPRMRNLERQQLELEVAGLLDKTPGLRLSTDSRFTEVDLAIDYNEEVRLGAEVAEGLITQLASRGIHAVRSSVHVNCWLGAFDKASAVEQLLFQTWGATLTPDDARFVYVGDSLNDAPLFHRVPLSVGVANVLEVLPELSHRPRYVTQAREGNGFVELVDAMLAARKTGA